MEVHIPTKPKRPCRHTGCPAITHDGYCPRHAHLAARTRRSLAPRPTAAQRGYDAEWRVIRNAVLEAEPMCRACKVRRATEVHHIVALRQGGTHHSSNLAPVCHSCHMKVERAHERMRR